MLIDTVMYLRYAAALDRPKTILYLTEVPYVTGGGSTFTLHAWLCHSTTVGKLSFPPLRLSLNMDNNIRFICLLKSYFKGGAAASDGRQARSAYCTALLM